VKRRGVPPGERLAALGKRLTYPVVRAWHIARAVPPPPPPVSPPSRLASAWCRGSGIEIGGSAHNPFGLDSLNVDLTGSMATAFKEMERARCGMALPVDLVAPAEAIPLPDGSVDFVVSSHVLEHLPDPVRGLLEWGRLIRPGGVIFMIVPHRDRIYDAGKERTTLAHLVEDYRTRADGQPEDPGGHHHVWVTEDVVALVNWMIGELRLPWEIVAVEDPDDKVGNGFAVVIRKNS
jgi:SAM-dependent methyltransferase